MIERTLHELQMVADLAQDDEGGKHQAPGALHSCLPAAGWLVPLATLQEAPYCDFTILLFK